MLLVLALCSILIPQFNTRMHINHAYAGLVLLIPLAIANRSVFKYWLGLVGIHLYSHLLGYGFGRALILPRSTGCSAHSPMRRISLQSSRSFREPPRLRR